ncbi:MAG: acyl-CoA reductase, partial [candidate division WOR-3 bacterium]
SLATALLVKSASLAKLSSQELVWTPLFIEILREVDPEIGSWVEWVHWDRRETERTRALVESADAVVVYGSDEAVASIRGMVRGETPLFAYGNRFALGLILQEADYGEAAQRLAQDCVRLYQTGCLSPQWVLVEGDRKAALRFAEELASAVEEQMRPFPIRLDFGTAVVVRREREAALFEEETHLWGASDLAWTIILRANPRLETLGTFNTTQVTPFRLSGDGDQGKGLLSLSIPWSRVQAVAFAGDLNRILSLLEPLCLPRLCQVGELQTPPFDWYENGRRLLHDLARWSRIE